MLRAIYGERAFRIEPRGDGTCRLLLDGAVLADSPFVSELKDCAERTLDRGPNPAPLSWIES